MDLWVLFNSLLWAVGMWIVVHIVRLIFADCDLTLQWAAKFGRKPAKMIGKVVWITGASSGIGEHLAYELAKAGCQLVLSARRRDELERVKQQSLLTGPLSDDNILVLPFDILKFDTHADAYATVVEKFNRVDILINNAGRSQRALFHEIHVDVDREMMELNVLAPLSLTRVVLPDMYKRKQGHIVVMNSVAGKVGTPPSASYCATKFALRGAFDCLRAEGRRHKLNVTVICPGPVMSNLLLHAHTGQPGEVVGQAMKTKMTMPTERCAFLCAAAISNKLNEVWIAKQPVLLLVYVCQYMPAIGLKVMGYVTDKYLPKFRDGVPE